MRTIVRAMVKSKHETKWTFDQMLRYAWQVAASLKDVHSIGNIDKSPAIAHTDIDIDQFLWIDGMFKLNDFNRARFMRWNIRTNEPCNFSIASSPGSVSTNSFMLFLEMYYTRKQPPIITSFSFMLGSFARRIPFES